ncbi:hypothetical protein AB4266_17925 [Vibrio breoganii]|uniref:hypothetical protein n=1 Tax=Vibrio breoganii TaxID=553239 RepID=UPI000C844F25|nr:hypothetical protein [Vibrio breoganii]PML37870.1 hypothetical protein BCT77_15230 [Vibrio breoganii]
MRVKLFAHIMHQTVKMAEKAPFLIPLIHKGNDVVVSLAYNGYKKNGVKSFEKFWIPAFYEYGQVRAQHIVKKMNIDTNSAASIGTYHDYEDPIFGVKGHWEQDSEGNPVRVETECVVCDQLNKVSKGAGCPDFCRHVVNAMEMGTGTAMNDTYVVEIGSLLSEGDETCRFTHKIQ